MSKSVKTIVSIAVAVAIPFAAPAIAGAIATSAGLSAATFGLSATAGATLGSAVVGAGLGAVGAELTGGDVGRGALMGGLGGAIGGHTSAQPAAAAQQAASNPYALDSSGVQLGTPGALGGPSVAPTDPYALGGSGVRLGDTSAGTFGTTTAAASPYSFTGADVPAGLANIPVDASAGFESATAAAPDAAAAAAAAPAAAPAAAAAAPITFADAVSKVPGEIAAKFSNPKALADLTLRAAGSIAGSLIAGDGMSDQEKQLLQAQTDELRALQQSNKALFDQKLQAAQDLIGESKYFDPEYFGLQRARKAQLAGARAKQAGLRGLTGSRRASEERRLDLATGRETGTAFDQGFASGLSGRLQTRQAGLSAMPAYPSADSGFTNLRAAYGAADERRRGAVSDFGKLYGSLTGTANARSVADIRKELAEAEARA